MTLQSTVLSCCIAVCSSIVLTAVLAIPISMIVMGKILIIITIILYSVHRELRCGGIFNNQAIAEMPQSVLVKEFSKSVNI